MNKGKKNTEQEIPKRDVSNTEWWTWPLESPLRYQLSTGTFTHPDQLPTHQSRGSPTWPTCRGGGQNTLKTPPADPKATIPQPRAWSTTEWSARQTPTA